MKGHISAKHAAHVAGTVRDAHAEGRPISDMALRYIEAMATTLQAWEDVAGHALGEGQATPIRLQSGIADLRREDVLAALRSIGEGVRFTVHAEGPE